MKTTIRTIATFCFAVALMPLLLVCITMKWTTS